MRLISIFSFIFCLFQLSVADLQCYKCIWTNGYLIDACSPYQFNESLVPVENCKYGCMTTASYLFDSMSSYTRACALRHVESRYKCIEGVESIIKEVNCFCATELCNGLGFGTEALKSFTKSPITKDDFTSESAINEFSSTNKATATEFTSNSPMNEAALTSFTSDTPINQIPTSDFTSDIPINQILTSDFTSESPANQVSDIVNRQPTITTGCCNSGYILKNKWWSFFSMLIIYIHLL